jgi:hypothetical protein
MAAVLATATGLLAAAGCSGATDKPEVDRGPASSPAVPGPSSPSPGEEPQDDAIELPSYSSDGVSVRVLPRMAAPGGRPQPAGAASQLVEVSVPPARNGTTVHLMARRDGAWQVVDSAEAGPGGLAELSSPLTGRHHAVTDSDGDITTPDDDVLGRRFSTDVDHGLVFSDEFDEDSVGPGRTWQTRDQGYHGVRLCSRASDRAARVRHGMLRLSVIDDPDRGQCRHKTGRDDYRLNGHVGTEESFTFEYGFAAARVRFHSERGQHGAFWMQGGSEIDVVEYFGDGHPRGGLTSYVYNWGASGTEHWGGTWVRQPDRFGGDWSNRFHVFSVEWTPEAYSFRIDDRVTQRVKGQPSRAPEYLVLSLLSSDYELKHSQTLPQHMDVDWVRVWDLG